MADRLSELLEQINDATNDIRDMASWKDVTVPDTMYLEPSVTPPAINLRCREHDWYGIHFASGNGGKVDAVDLLSQIREHMDERHG